MMMKYIIIIACEILLANYCFGQARVTVFENGFFTGSDEEKKDDDLSDGNCVFLSNGDFVVQHTWFRIPKEGYTIPMINRLNPSGEVKWSKRLKVVLPCLDCLAVTDFDEIITATSRVKTSSEFNDYSYLYKLDAEGDLIWSKGIKNLELVNIMRLRDGHFLASTLDFPDDLNAKSLLIKFTAKGELLWAKIYKNIAYYEIMESSDGGITMVGDYRDLQCASCMGILWLDKDGKKLDSRKIVLGTYYKSIYPKALREGKDYSRMVCGSLSENKSDYGFFMKLGNDHTVEWMKKYQVVQNDGETDFEALQPYRNGWLVNGLLFDHDGLSFSTNLIKLDDWGNILWSYSITDHSQIVVRRSSTDNDNHVYHTGSTNTSYAPYWPYLDVNNSFVVIQADSSGRALCYEEPLDVLVTDYTAYTYEPAVIVEDTFDVVLEDKIVELEKDDYITGYTICETTATNDVSADAGVLRLYPNPVSSTLSIDVQRAGSGTLREQAVDITDLLGRKLYEVEVGYDGHAEVDTKTLPPGMYIAVLRADMHQVQAVKFVVGR